jgi:ribosomal-protein-alanine N-acetyltransferase
MIFETPRLLVRPYTIDDAENFFLLNSDPDVIKYIRPAKTKEEAFQFLLENIDYYKEFPAYGRWAALEKSDDLFIGSFMIRPSTAIAGKIELGYSFFKEYWGKGYASELVNGGLEYAFTQLKLSSVIAITQVENIASQNVLLKSGFSQLKDINDKGRMVNLFSIKNILHD